MTDELTSVLRVHLDQQRKQQQVVEDLSRGIAAEHEQGSRRGIAAECAAECEQ